MALKGSIPPGSEIVVYLSTPLDNAVPAELVAGFNVPTETVDAAMVRVAPGGSERLAVRAATTGVFRVHVGLAGRRATGTLEVRVAGTVRDLERIAGDTWWFYTIKDDSAPDGATEGRHQPR